MKDKVTVYIEHGPIRNQWGLPPVIVWRIFQTTLVNGEQDRHFADSPDGGYGEFQTREEAEACAARHGWIVET